MKKSEIDDCLRLYRNAIDAYGNLTGKLKDSQAAADGIPLLRLTMRRLMEAEGDLDVIGYGLALLPELAENLIQEMRISAMVRQQAEKAGIVLRYDQEIT